jgi:hypothetical protein
MVSVRLDKRSMVASTCSNQACYMCLLINICVLPFLPTSYQLLPQHNAVELQTRYFFYYYYLNKKNQYTTIFFLFFSFFFSFFFLFFNFLQRPDRRIRDKLRQNERKSHRKRLVLGTGGTSNNFQ